LHSEKFFKKPIEQNTFEWIKSQPYIRELEEISNTKYALGATLKEVTLSSKFCELVGMDTSNIDKMHHLIKKFKGISCIFFRDHIKLADSFLNPDVKELMEYQKCGIQPPDISTAKESFLLMDYEREKDLYLAHMDIWNSVYIEKETKFLLGYCVFVIDKKLSETDTFNKIC